MLTKEWWDQVTEFQKAMGYDKAGMTLKQRRQYANECMLALNQEVAELVDSTPWKPWRTLYEQHLDQANIAREIIDILYFCHHIAEMYDIPLEDINNMAEVVAENNHKRYILGDRDDN